VMNTLTTNTEIKTGFLHIYSKQDSFMGSNMQWYIVS